MKKTSTININRLVFTIDEDACEKLENYLYTIENRFTDRDERNDILGDIEARIAEIFQQKLKFNKQVITLEDVNDIIVIIGSPSQFGASAQNQGNAFYRTGRGYRRVYRNTDDHVLGGVCSGLAIYWDFDPVILRVIFIIALLAGFGVLLYIILWIAIPPATTTAQKKEMYGQNP
jgi:phage shock protein PspC (stress-responsive transcriptional regulator)